MRAGRASCTHMLMVAAMLSACGRVDFHELIAAGDADTRDDIDATSASDAAQSLTNLLPAGDCEADGENYVAFQGQMSWSTTARNGALSCQSCMNNGFGTSTVDNQPSVVQGLALGEVYEAHAWVRAAPGQSDRTIELKVRQWTVDNNVEGPDSRSPMITVNDQWQELVVTHEIVEPVGEAFDVYIVQYGSGGDCFLADDIEVFRLP